MLAWQILLELDKISSELKKLSVFRFLKHKKLNLILQFVPWIAFFYQYFMKPKKESEKIDPDHRDNDDNNLDDDGFSDYEEIE